MHAAAFTPKGPSYPRGSPDSGVPHSQQERERGQSPARRCTGSVVTAVCPVTTVAVTVTVTDCRSVTGSAREGGARLVACRHEDF